MPLINEEYATYLTYIRINALPPKKRFLNRRKMKKEKLN